LGIRLALPFGQRVKWRLVQALQQAKPERIRFKVIKAREGNFPILLGYRGATFIEEPARVNADYAHLYVPGL